MLTEQELERLVACCRGVPLTSSDYVGAEFVPALMLTVIDYQQHTTTVERAMQHFNESRAQDLLSMADLKACLASFPDTREGNTDLAEYLWGYKFWTRARQLRDLTSFFDG